MTGRKQGLCGGVDATELATLGRGRGGGGRGRGGGGRGRGWRSGPGDAPPVVASPAAQPSALEQRVASLEADLARALEALAGAGTEPLKKN